MNILKYFCVFLFCPYLVFASASLPPPGLAEHHKELVGEWVYLKAQCQQWLPDVVRAYNETLYNKLYVEHLFINLWEFKFLQSELDPSSQRLPYNFCERDIFMRPKSYGNSLILSEAEVSHTNNCPVTSVLGPLGNEILMDYNLEDYYGVKYLRIFFYNWPGCANALIVYYKSK
ncbi:MAG: hypothetical protein KDD40_04015 [Bdellovibrionales bacterium]|nr:hypothetical protein [Bdellovibrionales bacterium]